MGVSETIDTEQSIMSSNAGETSDFEQEFSGVAEDIRTKQHSAARAEGTPLSDPPYPVDEQTKIELAKRASQAVSPGVTEVGYEPNSRSKPSHAQLEEMGHLRQVQKNRPVMHQDREEWPVSFDPEQPLDDFQGRMNDFRNKENQRAITEDEELRRKKRKGKMWFIGMVISIAVVGTGVGIAVGLRGFASRRDAEIDDVETMTFHDCYMRNDTRSSDRFSRIRNVVSYAWDWGDSPIDSMGSSQRAALCWLSDFDSFGLEVANGTEYEVVQRFALAAIYYHFVGTSPDPEGQELSGSNWLDAVHVCEWDFVACNTTNNRVSKMYLHGLRLSKSIPEDMVLMSDLVHLELNESHLTGQIPSMISMLTQLQVLNLGSNDLTGTIPSELGSLRELRALHLDTNHIQGEIPRQIFEIPKLHDLHLSANRLVGALPSAVQNATELTTISVESNVLSGTVPDVSRLKKLNYLRLGKNQFEGPFPDISRLASLVSIELSFNGFTGMIPSSVWLFPRLVTIDLESAYAVWGTLPQAVGLLTKLQRLNLGGTGFSGSIPTTLGNLSDLRILSLAGLVGLTGTIPTELGRLSRLVSLELPTAPNLSTRIPGEVCDLREEGSLRDLIVDVSARCD